MVWYGMVWYGMVWYGMVWYGMVWYGMVWYGMVWYGMVWYGMVWYGYGMVWYGVLYLHWGYKTAAVRIALASSLESCSSEVHVYVILVLASNLRGPLPHLCQVVAAFTKRADPVSPLACPQTCCAWNSFNDYGQLVIACAG